jgi:uroporphyrinogen decarboxylase
MLTKEQIKSCLSGEYTAISPAHFFWFDGDFIKLNLSFVAEMRNKYADDFIQTFPHLKKRAPDPVLSAGEFTDEWGCRFCHAPSGVGAHPTVPIINTLDDWEVYIDKYQPLIVSEHFGTKAAETVEANPDIYITMNIWRTFYERMYMLHGMEELWMDLSEENELFLRLLGDLKDFTIRAIREAAKTGVDCVYLADDWGMQDRLQISPESWKQYFKPAYADMIDTAHGLGLDVWIHSCGCIDSIVPEFIDIQLDVIGNLQTAAVDLKALSEHYKGKITFFGGLDVQRNLTAGTPDSIRREVADISGLFTPHEGKYIYAPSNSIMPETPVENVCALFEAMDYYRRSL